MGSLTTNPLPVYVIRQTEPKIYYAMKSFAMWAEVEYELVHCDQLLVDPDYHFSDHYDWHGELGWTAGGPQPGLAGFRDEWADALANAGLANEFEISGYWHGTERVYLLPSNWVEADVALPPVAERVAPLGR